MSHSVFLPELEIWALRIGANEAFAETMLRDPLLFYAFIALVGETVYWPADLTDELKQHNGRGDTEGMLKLMSALKSKIMTTVSSHYAAEFEKGEIVLNHFRGNAAEFSKTLKRTLDILGHAVDDGNIESNVASAIEELADLADFTRLERQLLLMSFSLRASPPFMVFMELACEDKQRARALVPQMLNCTEPELNAALSEEAALAKSGIVASAPQGRKLQPLSDFWVEFLVNNPDGLSTFARLVKRFELKDSAGAVGRLQQEDADIVKALLGAEVGAGKAINVMLYGATTVNKKAVVQKILDETGSTGWVLNTTGAGPADMASICFMAQRALADNKGEGIVLVVEKAPEVLTGRKMGSFLFFSFLAEEDGELKSGDEALLLENPVKTLWLAPAAKRISEEALGCFLYHSEIKRGTRSERRAKVQEVIHAQGFTDGLKQELALQAGLSEQQLRNALRVATIVTPGDVLKSEATVMHAVTRSQLALDRREKDDVRIPVTKYSLDYLNTSGVFSAQKLLDSLRKRPTGSLCFYGLSGTGKSQLAEYMAGELDKPLLAKQASELIDKYVGESEKHIAAMFDEADNEEAVLLLDEADSFLSDRSRAKNPWEVSQVNELLQRMERFKGIFICTTNLFQHLDTAALRRFTFKLEFRALTPDQRWAMLCNEAGIASIPRPLTTSETEEIRDSLNQMEMLTPGDFATIKRQATLLGEELTVEQWLEQLQIEVDMKRKAGEERKMGFN